MASKKNKRPVNIKKYSSEILSEAYDGSLVFLGSKEDSEVDKRNKSLDFAIRINMGIRALTTEKMIEEAKKIYEYLYSKTK